MRIIGSAAVLAALVVFSVSVGQAATKANDNPPAIQARSTLEQIGSLSASIAETADELALKTKGIPDSESPLDRLDTLKAEVNKVGSDLRLLEAEQGSLTGWERETVDEVLPLMKLVSAYTDGAVQMYASGRNHLWATPFPEYTARVSENAERVKELVDGHLKLVMVREQEQRLEGQVESSR